MLETDDHSITLVFESRLTIGERKPAILRFPFIWPSSLVDPDTRACRGKVKMTLVYEPPLDPAFGTEFVRVNLDAMLRQRHRLIARMASQAGGTSQTSLSASKHRNYAARTRIDRTRAKMVAY